MKSLWPVAPLLASAILALVLVPVGQAHADAIVPTNWPFVPSGLDVGDEFRLLFVTNEQTSIPHSTFSYSFFDDYVRTAVSKGDDDVRPYTDEFNVLASCGYTSARDHTGTTHTDSDRGVPVYWLNGDKVADDYADLYDGSWDSQDARDEHGNLTGERYVFTGSNSDGKPGYPLIESAPILDPGDEHKKPKLRDHRTDVCGTNAVATARTMHAGEELYQSVSSRDSERSMYGLSGVFTVSGAPGPSDMPDVIDIVYNSVTVSWHDPRYNGSSEIDGFDLEIRQPGDSWIEPSQSTIPSDSQDIRHARVTNLEPNKDYEVRVRSNNNHGNGAWSPTAAFHTTSDVPAAPDRPAATVGLTDVVLSWDIPAEGAAPISGYDVQIRQPGSSWTDLILDGPIIATTITLQDLNPDTTYQARVHANNSHGSSPWSQVVTFTTPDQPSLSGTPEDQ